MTNCSETQITYDLTQFCLITYPNLFISDLAYTTRIIYQVLRSNLKLKTLLKFLYTTNFLCVNLDYKKAKIVPMPLPYLFLT